jgi:proline iminopeptidase
MAYVQTGDGRRVWYETRGGGGDLVCLPGGPGISSRLLGSLGGLDRECRLILVDPRGSGRSDAPEQADGYRLADYAADVEAVREHLQLSRIALLGHSAGAFIALTYAATYPARVERLVLVSSGARFAAEHEAIAEAMRASRSHEPWYADAVAAGEEIAAADTSLSPPEFGKLLARGAGFCFANFGRRQRAHAQLLHEGVNVAAWLAFDLDEDLRPLLPQIAMPALVVAGEHDCLAAPAASQELADGLPRGRMLLLRDAGHYPFVDQPDAFRAAVSAFVRDDSPT